MLNNPGLPYALFIAVLVGIACGPAQRLARLLVLSLLGALAVEGLVAFVESAKWLSTFRFGQSLAANLLLITCVALLILLLCRIFRSGLPAQAAVASTLAHEVAARQSVTHETAGRQAILAHSLGLSTWLIPLSGAVLTLAYWLRVKGRGATLRAQALAALQFQIGWTLALLAAVQLQQLHPLLGLATALVWLSGLALNLRNVHRAWRARA